MAKRFDTEPEDLGDESNISSLLSKQLEQKIGLLERRIRELETKISATLNDPAFRNRINTDSESWQNNKNALGRIAGTLKSMDLGDMGRLKISKDLKARLDDDVN
jgi:hypothetical protein